MGVDWVRVDGGFLIGVGRIVWVLAEIGGGLLLDRWFVTKEAVRFGV